MASKAIEKMTITRKPSGHYIIDIYDNDGSLFTTVGAAKASPVAQGIRMVDRLICLSDKLGGYNEG